MCIIIITTTTTVIIIIITIVIIINIIFIFIIVFIIIIIIIIIIIAVKKGNDLTTIELTCCFETNLVKSNKFKKEKYDRLDKKLKIKLNLNMS